jgi:hypothetical protein
VGATSANNYHQQASYNVNNFTTDASPFNGMAGYNRAVQQRFKTDIVAPGGGDGVVLGSPVVKGSAEDNFMGPGAKGAPNDGLNSNPNFAGTSFSTPHVTGVAALLTDLGNQIRNEGGAGSAAFTNDHRVLKAIILNGATHDVTDTAGNAWSPVGVVGMKNGTQPINIGWSAQLGTGLLNASNSLVNYAAGKQGPGPVGLVGWDLGTLNAQGNINEYDFNQKFNQNLNEIHATLAWDKFLRLNDTNGNQMWDPGETFTPSLLNNLDLQFWDLTKNQDLYQSSSDMDSIQYISYDVPQALWGDSFALKIVFDHDFAGLGAQTYGLAWQTTALPEPGVLPLSVVAVAFGLVIARRRRRAA